MNKSLDSSKELIRCKHCGNGIMFPILRIGFDIDGVISKNEKATSVEDCKEAEPTNINIPSEEHQVFIITARGRHMREVTENWLNKNGINYTELYLYDGTFNDVPQEIIDNIQSLFKSAMIKNLGLDIYVEDRAYVRKQLRGNCSVCEILSPEEFKNMRWGK